MEQGEFGSMSDKEWESLNTMLRASMSSARSCEARTKAIIQKYPQLGCHEDARGNTALMAAAAGASLGIIKMLIPLGNAKAKNCDGSTALMIAVQHGRLALVKELLPQSDPWAIDHNGWMPLTRALAAIVRNGHSRSAGAHRLAALLLEGMEREPIPKPWSQASKAWRICWQMAIQANCEEILEQACAVRSLAEAAELGHMVPEMGGGQRAPFKASL